MRKILSIFVFCILVNGLTHSQTVYQKAIDYFVLRLDSLDINYQNDSTDFDIQKNTIYYSPKVSGTHSRLKISHDHTRKASVDNFYLVIHDPADIHVTVYKADIIDNLTSVKIEIRTNYNITSEYFVYFDNKKEPYKLIMKKI